jgi:hypothetical protein
LAWGATLAVYGLGLTKAPVGRLIDVYWPVLFMGLGLGGVIHRLVRGRRGAFFYLLVFLVAGAFLASHLHLGRFDGWTIFWAVVVLAGGLSLLWRRPGHGDWDMGRFGIGDQDSAGWTDAGRNPASRRLSHLIGDVRLDLADMHFPDGESTLDVSCFIGDITILVPRDLSVSVVGEASVGDVRVFGQRADGLGRRLFYRSPEFETARRRVVIYAHLTVGDVTVQRF